MTPGEIEAAITDGLSAMDWSGDEAISRKNAAYAALMQKWNKTYNLTAVRDMAKVIPLHILDSLAILPWVQDAALLDVGSGGGLPGVPLAIARPQMAVTTLDSNSKKTAFQRQAAIELGLSNLTVVCSRVESFQSAQKFPQIVSRAFSEITDFVTQTRHLLAPGGRWLAMKGVRPDDEIARLPDWAAVVDVIELVVPNVDGARHLVILQQR